MAKIIHKDLSYAVNGCIFSVHNEVGPGLREECYQKALELRLAEQGISFIAKPHTRREFWHRAEVADVFEPDFVVADAMVVEVKALREGMNRFHFMQAINYTKFWGLSLGILVNFAEAQAVIQRVPYALKPVRVEEDYTFIKPLLTPTLRKQLRIIREALLDVHRLYGIGYWDTTYCSLVDIEVRHRGLDCRRALEVTPKLNEKRLPVSPITPLEAASSILIEVEALHEHISARAVRTMQSHLKFTGARFGLVVNFGKDKFEIRGVRPLKKG